MLFSLRRLRAVSAWALVLVFVLAAPASAQGGFEELTLAEIGRTLRPVTSRVGPITPTTGWLTTARPCSRRRPARRTLRGTRI